MAQYNGPRNRCIIYRRISDRRKQHDGHSLDTQLHDCRRYAATQNWTIVEEITDEISGLITTREGYLRLVGMAKRQQVDIVLVWRLDRLGREDGEGITFCNSLDLLGIETHSATQGKLDPMTRGILFVVAKQESRNISARVTPNMQRAVTQGKHVNRPPFGYRFHINKEDDATRGLLIPYEPEASIIREMFSMIEKGWSIYGVTCWLNQKTYADESRVLPPSARDGLVSAKTNWNNTSVAYILKNKIYKGIVEFDRTTKSKLRPSGPQKVLSHKGRHEALISPEQFKEVQDILSKRKKVHRVRPETNRTFLFGGLLRCGICGRSCTGSWNNGTRLRRQGKDPHANPIYKCEQKGHATYSGRKLEKLVLHSISELEKMCSSEFLQKIREQITQEEKGNFADVARELQTLEGRRTKLLTKCSNAAEDLADRILTRDLYQGIVAKAEKEISSLTELIDNIRKPADPTAFIQDAEEFLYILTTTRNLNAHLVITNKSFEVIMSQVTEDDIKDSAIMFAPKELEVGDFLEMGIESKYRIISKIVDHVIIERGKEPRIVWRDWAQKILERIA